MKQIKIFIFFFLIPLLLITFWIVPSLIFNKLESFTTVTHYENTVNYDQFPKDNILRNGNKISGRFHAKEKNLGTLTFYFEEYIRQDIDFIVSLRLGRVGSNSWLYQIQDNSRVFKEDSYYTFGFPILNNKVNEQFSFEISVEGLEEGNYIKVSKDSFLLNSKYKFSKTEIMSSPEVFADFLKKKVYFFLTNPAYLVITNHFLIAFFLYIIGLLYFSKRLRTLPSISLALIFLDSFIIRSQIEAINISLLLLLVISMIQHKKSSNWSLKVLIVFFSISIILALFGFHQILNKISVWMYFFLCIYIIQRAREAFYEKTSEIHQK